MNSFLSFVLLFENKAFPLISKEIKADVLTYLLPIFILALIWEFFNEMNFLSIAKRLFLALLIINFYPSIHEQVTDTSLSISSKLISKYGAESALVYGFKDLYLTNLKRKNSSFNLSLLFKKWTDSIFLSALYFFCALSFTFLKAIFSLVFHLSMIFAPILALLSLLPPLKDITLGLLKSTLWCFLVPLFIAIILISISNFIVFDISDDGFLVSGLDGYIQLFCLCLLLLGSAAFARGLINSEGLLFFADRTSQTMTLGSMSLINNMMNSSNLIQTLKRNEGQIIENGIGKKLTDHQNQLARKLKILGPESKVKSINPSKYKTPPKPIIEEPLVKPVNPSRYRSTKGKFQ